MKLKKNRTAPCGAARSCTECPSMYCLRRALYTSKDDFEIVSDFLYEPQKAVGVAIDIGTTTVAATRYENGRQVARVTELNAQRVWGADVLSRIEAAVRGNGPEQTAAINDQLARMIKAIKGEGHKIVVAANTTMISLLMGWDCSGLGTYPFRAHSLETIEEGHKTIIGGVSAFVGGDITSGLYMCGFDESDDVNMFIDLGTNGEMAIGNRHRILCTSTAAGPAFEGGRISCGTGSVDGAICSVSLGTGEFETIGEKKPSGICGTGIVELLYELKKAGYIDSTGLLIDRYTNGYPVADGIVFTERDIRELQTAKSAIRAGIEILIKEYGAADIKNVYIAGGFGRRLNTEKACGIGLLPEPLRGRYTTVGNSALGGAVKLLDNNGDTAAIERIRGVSKDFSLAENAEFSELFLKYMNF